MRYSSLVSSLLLANALFAVDLGLDVL